MRNGLQKDKQKIVRLNYTIRVVYFSPTKLHDKFIIIAYIAKNRKALLVEKLYCSFNFCNKFVCIHY